MWGFLFAFFKAVAVSVLVSLLMPKPKPAGARRYSLSEFQVPTATEDRSLPLPFGTCRIAGNVLWFGDYSAAAVRKSVRTGLFSSTKVTLGYRYYIGQWLSLAGVVCDSVHEVRLGERVAWAGALTLSTSAATVLPVSAQWRTTEGQEVPDGFEGRLEFFNFKWAGTGLPLTPPANGYMAAQLGYAGTTVPAYPDMLHLVVHGPSSAVQPGSGFIGSGPNIPPLSVTVRRMANMDHALRFLSQYPYPSVYGLNKDTIGPFVQANGNIDGDANPAFALVELLTTRVPGIGPRLISHTLDLADFLRAGETLKAEGNGVSFVWETSKPVDEICNAILAQIGGVWRLNTATGQLGMRLLRETDEPVAVFDSSNIISLDSVRRVGTEEAINEVEVPFTDRSLEWAERTVIARDPAGYKAAGATISRQAEFIGVSRELLARQLATRELRSSATPLAQVRFTAAIEPGLILQPGDLVSAEHPELGQTLRLRVLGARFGGYENRGRIELDAVEDVFRAGSAGEVTATLPPSIEYPSTPAPLTDPLLVAAPYALTGSDQDRLLYTAEDSGTSTDTFQTVVQDDRTSWLSTAPAEYMQGEQEPSITGTLTAALPSWNVTTFSLALTASQVEQWTRAPRGTLFLLAGTEWMRCSSWSLDSATGTLTASGVLRGILDTIPARHLAGARVRILLGFALIEAPLKTKIGNDTLDGLAAATVRAESRGRGGVLALDDAAPSTATWQYSANGARAARPLPPALVSLGASVFGMPSVEDVPLDVTRLANVALTWKRRSRLARAPLSYFSTSHQIEPGLLFGYAFAYETGPGTWSSYGAYVFVSMDALTVDVPTAGFPAGRRGIKGRFISRRTLADGGTIDSVVAECYWTLSA